VDAKAFCGDEVRHGVDAKALCVSIVRHFASTKGFCGGEVWFFFDKAVSGGMFSVRRYGQAKTVVDRIFASLGSCGGGEAANIAVGGCLCSLLYRYQYPFSLKN
jgi:hypothetical protein